MSLETKLQSMSYRAIDYPIFCRTSKAFYDLRRTEDRDSRFSDLLCDGILMFNPGNYYIAQSCLHFDYLSRHLMIRRILLEANEPSIFIMEIIHVLTENATISRFIFKSKHINLWRPLVSAQIENLSFSLSGIDSERIALLMSIFQSMLHWNAKQLLFAQKRGLFSMIAGQYNPLCMSDKSSVMMDILSLGYFLSFKFKIERFVPDHLINYGTKDEVIIPMDGALLSLEQCGPRLSQMVRNFGNICGWPPCSYNQKRTETFPVVA